MSSMLVSRSGLDAMRRGDDGDDPGGLVIADTRSFAEYVKGHIPGAVHLDLFAFHWADTSADGLAGFAEQAGFLMSAVGAVPGKRIVFYDSESGMLAARGVWMARYLSHGAAAAMLDGGMRGWAKKGLPVEEGTVCPRYARFSGVVDTGLACGFEHIRDNLDSLRIIDARSPGEYDGSVARAARRGHIPNAINVDWRLNLAADGAFKSDEELSRLYPFPRDEPVVTYCQGGYRAANTFVVLKRLGFADVRVYPGSWGEWGNRPDLPVEE